ncbi:MAG: hypothetical protein ACI4TT_01655 [Christensenellales bacterium]
MQNSSYSYASSIFVLTDDCLAVAEIRLLDAEGNTVHTFVKQSDIADEPVADDDEQTVTADNLIVDVGGIVDDVRVSISYGSDDKYIRLDGNTVTIEFVSYDATNNTLTFKRTDTNETFDLIIIESHYDESANCFAVYAAYYNGEELAC